MSWWNYWQAKKWMERKAKLPPVPTYTQAQKDALRAEVEREVNGRINEWCVECNSCEQTGRSNVTAARIAKGFTTLLTRRYWDRWEVVMDYTTDEVCLVTYDPEGRLDVAQDHITPRMV